MTMPTFTDGVLVNATILNALSTGVNAVNTVATGAAAPRAYVPTAVVKISSLQSIGNNANTVVTWNTAGINNDAMWSSGNTVTIKTAGVYVAWLQPHFTAAANGIRAGYILLNGTAIGNAVASRFTNPISSGDGNFYPLMTPPMQLAVNATLAAMVYQNSTLSLTLDTSDSGMYMAVVRLGS